MAAPSDVSALRSGALRRDIRLIPPGPHGDYAMIFDPAAGSYFKLSVPAWKILARWDRDRSFEEFRRRLRRAGIPASAEELLALRQFLLQNNLLTPDPAGFALQLAERRRMKSKYWWLKVASMYLYFKLPPLHPQPFIDRIRPWVGFIGSRTFVLSLLVPAVAGYLLALRNFAAVAANFEASFSWAGLVKYFFAIVLLKFVHEGGHLAANMHFNCRVRAIGISMIFLYPRFFSDTTDSWRLPPRQRLLIDAGGLLSEMICGGLAALAWCYLPPGHLQSTMFFIFAVSTVSTLFVNGNPLIRFDGYYILCDLLGVENLMQRSVDYIKRLSRHWLFGLGPAPEEERPLLLFSFGVAAFIYRFLLYTSIILVIYNSMIKAVAIVLLVLEVLTIFVMPLYNEVRIVRALSKRAGRRANLTFIIAVGLAAALILFLPLTWRTRLPGEIRRAVRTLVAIPETGYLASEPPQGPVPVAEKGVIVRLVSPRLDFETARRRAVLEEEKIRLAQQETSGKTAGDGLLTRRRIDSEKNRISELEARRRKLCVTSGEKGVFVPAFPRLSRGALLPAGTVIGTVESGETVIDAYSSDDQLRRLKTGMKVHLRLRDSRRDVPGTITAINPVPVTFFPSPLLHLFGGPVKAFPVPGRRGEFSPEHPLFRVVITPDEPLPFQPGRTLRVLVENREILFDQFVSAALYFFRREF
ncbi:MAG: hypothetical protein IJS01_13900 [Lentisphaeria bacterium]|nr:hypothetical protein [Lentisphaeria bacterium]